MINTVVLSRRAMKDLKSMPEHIVDKLETWIDAVERESLAEIRKIPGYHDEPLKGNRQGQRSIRLSRSYRAIYVIVKEKIVFVRIEEVSKHEY